MADSLEKRKRRVRGLNEVTANQDEDEERKLAFLRRLAMAK